MYIFILYVTTFVCNFVELNASCEQYKQDAQKF